jgi:hypothetical protein
MALIILLIIAGIAFYYFRTKQPLEICKECGKEVSTSARRCPHCGRYLWSTGRIVILIFLGLFFFGGIFSTLKNNDQSPPGKQSVKPVTINEVAPRPVITNNVAPVEKFTLIDFNLETTEYGNKHITGTVKNNTGREIRYVQISFALFDQDGAQIGTAWTNITNLEAGGIWKFEAIAMNKNAVSAKFKGISSY